MTRFLILGAGATGTSLAAQLDEAGVPYVLVGHPDRARFLREQGITYRRPQGAQEFRPVVAGSPDEVDLSEDDVFLLATKVQDADRILTPWAWTPVRSTTGRAVLGADLPVVTVQNGLATEDIALRRFSTVYAGSLRTPATYVTERTITLRSAPKAGILSLGRYPNAPIDERVTEIAELLRRAAYVVQLTPRISGWKATKILHSVTNGVELFERGTDTEREALNAGLVSEAKAVIARAGIELVDRAAETTEDLTGFKIETFSADEDRLSTWQSFSRRSASSQEGDFLNGEIVLLARKHGVLAPVNEALQRALGLGFAQRSTAELPSVGDILLAAEGQ